MKRVNVKTFPKYELSKSHYVFMNEALEWGKDFVVDVRKKYEATKKMGLHERELWLSRLVVGILADVPEEILQIIDNYWEEILKDEE